MRFIFKTSYEQDIRLVKHGGQTFWYGLLGLALAAAPLLPSYLSQLTFVCIYALVGVELSAPGYTGQISLGHAAFLAVGAYTEAVLQAKGAPFGVSLIAGALAGIAGIVIGYRPCASPASTSRLRPSPSASSCRRGGDALGVGDAGHSGITLKSISIWSSSSTRSGSWLPGARVAAGLCFALEPVARAHRPGVRRDPRLRDLGAEHGHPSRAHQDHGVRDFGRAHRPRRRALRAQAGFHQPGAVRHPAVDRAGDDDLHRRHRLDARRRYGAIFPIASFNLLQS